VPSPAVPSDAFTDLARALSKAGVDWYVFGAQATIIWGRPRLTSDVDITIRLGSLKLRALMDLMQSEGFQLRIATTPDFLQRTRVVPLRHRSTGLDVDLVLAGPGLEDGFLERAVAVTIGTTTIPVISAEDLIVTKILAGRSKDLEDVRGVLAERGDRISLDAVRQVLQMLETALGHSDLLPVLDAEIARWRRRSG